MYLSYIFCLFLNAYLLAAGPDPLFSSSSAALQPEAKPEPKMTITPVADEEEFMMRDGMVFDMMINGQATFAVIDGKEYRVGDHFKDYLILDIKPTGFILEKNGVQVILNRKRKSIRLES